MDIQLGNGLFRLGNLPLTDGQLTPGGLLGLVAAGRPFCHVFFLNRLWCFLLFRLFLGLHLPVLGKAHGIIRNGLIGQLPNPGRKAVDEVPVMGDEEQRAVIGLHRLLNPLPGIDIQVVGGLVQDQEIDLIVHQHA